MFEGIEVRQPAELAVVRLELNERISGVHVVDRMYHNSLAEACNEIIEFSNTRPKEGRVQLEILCAANRRITLICDLDLVADLDPEERAALTNCLGRIAHRHTELAAS